MQIIYIKIQFFWIIKLLNDKLFNSHIIDLTYTLDQIIYITVDLFSWIFVFTDKYHAFLESDKSHLHSVKKNYFIYSFFFILVFSTYGGILVWNCGYSNHWLCVGFVLFYLFFFLLQKKNIKKQKRKRRNYFM